MDGRTLAQDASPVGPPHRVLQDWDDRPAGSALPPPSGARNATACCIPRAGRPVRGNPSHSGLAFQELHQAGVRPPFWYTNRRRFAQVVGRSGRARDAMGAEIVASSADTIIISSEEFIRFGSTHGVPAEQTRDMVRALPRRPSDDRLLRAPTGQVPGVVVQPARQDGRAGSTPLTKHDARSSPASPVLRHTPHRLRSHDRVLGPSGRLRRAHRARLRPSPQGHDLRRLQCRCRATASR